MIEYTIGIVQSYPYSLVISVDVICPISNDKSTLLLRINKNKNENNKFELSHIIFNNIKQFSTKDIINQLVNDGILEYVNTKLRLGTLGELCLL